MKIFAQWPAAALGSKPPARPSSAWAGIFGFFQGTPRLLLASRYNDRPISSGFYAVLTALLRKDLASDWYRKIDVEDSAEHEPGSFGEKREHVCFPQRV
jgi:hypothetical protein